MTETQSQERERERERDPEAFQENRRKVTHLKKIHSDHTYIKGSSPLILV